MELDIELKAKNSSGDQRLFLACDRGEYSFTLTGQYRGQGIQIDFDVMKRPELEELHLLMGIILENSKAGE